MGQRTVTSAVQEAGATVVAMLVALGTTAVVATLLAMAVATIVAAILMLVACPALVKGRSPSGRSSRYKPPGPLLFDVGAGVNTRPGSLGKNLKNQPHGLTRRERARS